ncbi:D-2-hydroxyacid dehydrogenase family protein [Variovorax boronicumulans]|uniref:D-2-hydroxyacid dehydrogenase family protein n=1 Tax=Variovorax boronicumulans TaxID=436515 RepID=UPI001C572D09
MKIAVIDDYQRVAQGMADWSVLSGCEVDFFHQTLRAPDELVARLASYDVIVAMRERTRFPRDILQALPALRLLVTTGMVNRSIDLAAARERGIVVCGTPWAEDATVELTWALILGLAHAVPQEDASLRAGRWQSALGTSLAGKTLGVVGLGTIGGKVARIGQAFGMRVIAYSPHLTQERADTVGATAVGKQALFAESDVVSVHMILSDATRAMVGADEIGHMKGSAFLVNTARGPLVDEAALASALRERRIAGAALDVYSHEPIDPAHPLLHAPNTILTPHIGYVTHEVYRAWYGAVVEDILAYRAGQPIRRIEIAPLPRSP